MKTLPKNLLLLVFAIFISNLFIQCDSGQNNYRRMDNRGAYMGDQVCKSCHEAEYADWAGSHHDLAMQEANDSTTLGNFNNVTFTSHQVTSRFYQKDGKYFVNTEGTDGQFGDFEVRYTFGVTPLQQYLVEFPGGRLQCLHTAWDSEKNVWFDLMPGDRLPPDDWLHWTKGSMTWNTMCADCHSTNLQKNYDETTDAFQTKWDIINVSCEACHGPGEQHVEYANSKDYEKGKKVAGSFMYQPIGQNKQELVDDCARCHSRRGPITEVYDHTGSFLDHYVPSIIAPALYHADGQILEEVYVYGSFLQSKMYGREVNCNDCHNPHSLKLKFEGNALCIQCHLPENYDNATHHFHEAGTEGAACVSCHMPGRIYMGNDFRRDHSFRVPRPDLSEKYGTPNACNDCHDDQSFAWQSEAIVKWYGPDRPLHFSPVLTAAHSGDYAVLPELLALIGDDSIPDIIKASAVQIIGNINLPETNQKVLEAIKSKDPFIRHTAINALAQYPQEERLQYLTPLLSDSIRAVRIRAAYTLADVPDHLFVGKEKEAFQKAITEFETSLSVQSDFPSGQLMKGQYFHKKGDLVLAEKAYREAIRQDPYLAQPFFYLANLKYNEKDIKAAQKFFESAIQNDSNYVEAHFSLGLLQAETDNLPAAEVSLSKAATISGNPRYYYNWGLTLQNLQKPKEAEQAYLTALSIDPQSEANLYALSILYIQQKENENAKATISQLLTLNPQNPDYQNLLRAIEQ
jgi:tetratricopeptide (TPR) repeat protein